MIVTLALVSFGIYLGQEYPNLPVVKNIFYNFVSYLQNLQVSNSLNEHNENSSNLSNSSNSSYVSYFKKTYSFLSSFFSKTNNSDTTGMSDFVQLENTSNVFKTEEPLEQFLNDVD
jgi:hypothetical protein